MKIYNVIFHGYRRDENKDSLPSYSGIYMVYRCTYDSENKTVLLKELIYIGKAENIHDRINSHDKHNEFIKELQQEDEQICYSYAEVPKDDLDVVENALVFAQKPKLNELLKDSFKYEPAQFSIEGKTALLKYTKFQIG
jgi:excinuclease UvrABC nuclease subunit